MKLSRGELPVLHLRAGELVVSAEPLLVSTILGSCISVTMFHPLFTTGAICHGLLPNGHCGEWSPGALRYVDCSVRQMVRRLEALGIRRSDLQVKVFGGADVLVHPASAEPRSTIGEQNVRAACVALGEEGLSVLAH
ncbi:MAG: chemotaxis protein CheD, partial [Deltaproteobacteria bacterium]|nr:chemotaxis protein CheD [Deltaproteobacteria bacterium]